jgi:hypothetical protein
MEGDDEWPDRPGGYILTNPSGARIHAYFDGGAWLHPFAGWVARTYLQDEHWHWSDSDSMKRLRHLFPSEVSW